MYLSFLKIRYKKQNLKKSLEKNKLRVGRKSYLYRNIQNYSINYLRRRLIILHNRVFFFRYFKYLKKNKLLFNQLKQKKNFYTYKFKTVYIKYFKSNYNLLNIISSKFFFKKNIEKNYYSYFFSKKKIPNWLLTYIIKSYKYYPTRIFNRLKKKLKSYQYFINKKINNIYCYWYKVKYLKKTKPLAVINSAFNYNMYRGLLYRKTFFKIPKFFFFFRWYRLRLFAFNNIPDFFFLFKKLFLIKLKKKIRRKVFSLFLIYRFPKLSLKKFNIYARNRKWYRSRLPMFAQLNLIYRFLLYRGVYMLIGNHKHLLPRITFSGYMMPYLITKNRKSFWRNFCKCFTLFNYSYLSNNNNFSYLLFSKLIKLSLFKNIFVEIGWAVATRLVFNKKLLYNKFSNYYFSTKTLLIPNFYFNKIYNLSNVNSYFNHMLNNYTSFYFSDFFQKNKKKKKIIRIHKQEITAMRWIRETLKNFFIEKPKRAWFITRFCKYFEKVKTAGIQYLLWLELRLPIILIRSKVVYLLDDAYDLIKNGYVFINGNVCLNINYTVKVYDRIQLGLTKSLHLYHRNLLNNVISKYKKLPAYVYSRFSGKSKFETVRRNTSARWPLKALWFRTDIPRYLEVDYITMTIFVLYYPLCLKDIFPFYYLHLKFLSSRCYNWRFFH